ncbi:MAG: c-type cytochrome, methanol metabolism-related [Candidatus Acidiferrales bacterium]
MLQPKSSWGKRVRRISFVVVAAVGLGVGFGASVQAEDKPGLAPYITDSDGCFTQEGAKNDNGKWVLPDGTPTFHICKKDGTLVADWGTYNGYRRYHSECHVCHGPNGLGSSYAPALADSLKTMDYSTFLSTVASGRIRDEAGTKFVMPTFGDNKNVMCYVNDLYLYLRARASGDLPAGQLGGHNHEDKPEVAKADEKACLGD